MVFGQNLNFFDFGEKTIPGSRAPQEKQDGANFSSVHLPVRMYVHVLTCMYPREFPVYIVVLEGLTEREVTHSSSLRPRSSWCRGELQILNSPTSPPPETFHMWTHPPSPTATIEAEEMSFSRFCRNTI